MSEPKHLLIWDGDCGFCQRVVAWVKSRDRADRFRTITYQRCPDPPLTSFLRSRAKRAVQVLAADGRRFEGGRASLFVLHEIGWHRRLIRVAQIPPCVWAVDLGYKFVARNRLWFSRWFDAPVCSISDD